MIRYDVNYEREIVLKLYRNRDSMNVILNDKEAQNILGGIQAADLIQ